MQRYILIRLGQSIITLLGVSVIVFMMARLSGNPLYVLLPPEAPPEAFERLTRLWGLDRPLHEQYITFISNAVQGNFGQSFKWQGQSAMGLVMQRMPATLELAAFAIIFSIVLAVPIGVLSATKRDTWMDTLGKIIALLGQSLPTFWLGIVLIWVFAANLGWFPTSGRGGIQNIVLPGIALGWFSVAAFMRLIRSSMLNVLDTEYVKLARVKGLPERKVIWKHALKNASIAPITFFGAIIVQLITGSVTIETVFSWPGVGLLALEAVNARDYQVVQAVAFLGSAAFVFMNLMLDIAYAYIDPRVRYK